MRSGGTLTQLFVLLQVHTRALHDRRFQLYNNGVLLCSSYGSTRGLLRLSDCGSSGAANKTVYLIVCGAAPATLRNEVLRMLTEVEVQCGGAIELVVSALCPRCVQRGGGGEREYAPLADDGTRCVSGCVLTDDDRQNGALSDAALAHRSSLWDPVDRRLLGDSGWIDMTHYLDKRVLGRAKLAKDNAVLQQVRGL